MEDSGSSEVTPEIRNRGLFTDRNLQSHDFKAHVDVQSIYFYSIISYGAYHMLVVSVQRGVFFPFTQERSAGR